MRLRISIWGSVCPSICMFVHLYCSGWAATLYFNFSLNFATCLGHSDGRSFFFTNLIIHPIQFFFKIILDGTLHLYMRLCLSIPMYVRPSVLFWASGNVFLEIHFFQIKQFLKIVQFSWIPDSILFHKFVNKQWHRMTQLFACACFFCFVFTLCMNF